MNQAEVRQHIEEEVRRVTRRAIRALVLDRDDRHPAVLFVRQHGAQEIADHLGLSRISDPSQGRPAAQAWVRRVTDELTRQACAKLPQDQRTLVAICDALDFPRD